MVFSDIKQGLTQFVERYDSQTYLGSYRETSRSSLLNDGLSTRANSLWKMAEYVVAQYDNNTSTSIDDYISGWKTLASNANNQYLIIEENKSAWAMYDAKGYRLGGEEFIQEYFSRMKKIGIKKNSMGETSIHQHPLQQIFYGAPGTGKSHRIKNNDSVKKADEKNLVFRTTFHPDSDYSTLVGCYKPRMEDDKIKYEFSPQTFTDAYVKAWRNPDKQVYLVIEEINRGNCAQIFGDLFQLLDRKGGVSEYPINADADLRQYLEKEDVLGVGHEGIANGKLKLPANLNILATMNTSDQSLFPMDSAFKRRWSWESVPIDYKNADSSKFIITIGDNQYKWTTFLESVNKKIVKATDSEDKQMGNFFINDNVDERQFIDKVMFYLWNDVCKEEFHTTNNFFRNYTDDKKTETIEFSFNALFESNSTKLLQGFMEYLEVCADGDGSKNPDTEGNTESEAE